MKVPSRPRWQSRYHGVRMTEEEYLSLPEEKPYLEYVDGVVLQKPMANFDHLRLAGELVTELVLYSRRNGGVGGPEGRARMGDLPNYRIPDVSYWAPGRPTGNDTLPTLAVEVRSPDQTMTGLRQKSRQYRQAGVDVCWLIDPKSRTVEVFEGRVDARLVKEPRLSSRFLPGFELNLEDLFRVLD